MNSLEAPKVTYYVRALDNITGKHITEWDGYESSAWYYGKCNGLKGGESEYIVEFDIWNNEAAFNAGMYDDHNLNAINCRLSTSKNSIASSKDLFNLAEPVIYARCTTLDYKSEFVPIRNNMMLTNITGNINPNLNGVIQGVGDHAILQTKVILPPNCNLSSHSRYAFDLVFYYDFE